MKKLTQSYALTFMKLELHCKCCLTKGPSHVNVIIFHDKF